jgi:hypothetical protein
MFRMREIHNQIRFLWLAGYFGLFWRRLRSVEFQTLSLVKLFSNSGLVIAQVNPSKSEIKLSQDDQNYCYDYQLS